MGRRGGACVDVDRKGGSEKRVTSSCTGQPGEEQKHPTIQVGRVPAKTKATGEPVAKTQNGQGIYTERWKTNKLGREQKPEELLTETQTPPRPAGILPKLQKGMEQEPPKKDMNGTGQDLPKKKKGSRVRWLPDKGGGEGDQATADRVRRQMKKS